jgi:hypothetical protein
MHKNSIILCGLVCLFLITTVAWGDTVIGSEDFSSSPDHSGAYGDWHSMRGRLYQSDEDQRLAKINFRVPQSGTMEYRFDVRYEGGGYEDRMGGFGLQVFADKAFAGRSWGNGKSYLLWLNYDENTTYGRPGFQAQVYKSRSHVDMRLLEDYQAQLPVKYLDIDYIDVAVPARIQVNGDTGLVKVWDPTRSGVYYRFYLDEAPGRGNYLALRTNSLAVSFDNLEVIRVDR